MEKRIIILVPTAREASYFPSNVPFHICGVGMAECAAATARLIAGPKPDLVILTGIAGAYSDDIAVGETVVVSSETIADLRPQRFRKTYNAPAVPVIRHGFKNAAAATVNSAGILAGHSPKAEIENMEGAAFFAVCEQLDVPAMEVRTVSNRVGELITAENLELSAKNLAAAVEKIFAQCT